MYYFKQSIEYQYVLNKKKLFNLIISFYITLLTKLGNYKRFSINSTQFKNIINYQPCLM